MVGCASLQKPFTRSARTKMRYWLLRLLHSLREFRAVYAVVLNDLRGELVGCGGRVGGCQGGGWAHCGGKQGCWHGPGGDWGRAIRAWCCWVAACCSIRELWGPV